MHTGKGLGMISALVAGMIVVACDPPAAGNNPSARPLFWEGCLAGGKYTGGGRVDPPDAGKVTFGFNVHAEDCNDSDIKGELQVVFHDVGQTLVHSLTIDHFASWDDPDRGQCAEFSGTARAKHVDAGGDWHEHRYTVVVCDKAEPGRGADRFSFSWDDGNDELHQNVYDQVLTGGNIQAHKS